jgi:hypothetical protein
MFVIVHVRPTDYEPSNETTGLQEIVDDLNRDALDSNEVDRWMVSCPGYGNAPKGGFWPRETGFPRTSFG